MPLGSIGAAGRLGDVHLDVIESIEGPRRWDLATEAIEDGSEIGVHRKRTAYELRVTVLASDVEPFAGASLVGQWEADHARKTRERIEALGDAGTRVEFFDGVRFWRGLTGRRTWSIAAIDSRESIETSGARKGATAWRATLTIRSVDVFATTFTPIDPEIGDELADDLDGAVDSGAQSTETVPADVVDTLPP